MDQPARWAGVRWPLPPGRHRRAVVRPRALSLALLLPVALLLIGSLPAACSPGPGAPEPVELAELVADPDRYLGELVIVEGVVQAHDDPAHAWIEDEVPHRVGLEPLAAVDDLLGQVVRVVGRFDVVDAGGRVLEVEQVQVVSEQPRA